MSWENIDLKFEEFYKCDIFDRSDEVRVEVSGIGVNLTFSLGFGRSIALSLDSDQLEKLYKRHKELLEEE